MNFKTELHVTGINFEMIDHHGIGLCEPEPMLIYVDLNSESKPHIGIEVEVKLTINPSVIKDETGDLSHEKISEWISNQDWIFRTKNEIEKIVKG